MIDLSKLASLVGNVPIQLGGGWTLTPPAAGAAGAASSDPLAALVPLLAQVAGTATGNPLVGVGVSALGVLINHLFATQTQMNAAQQAGQPVDALMSLEASLKSQIQAIFAPHLPAPAHA